MINLSTHALGIIGGNEKRELEKYIGDQHFRQRKSYDEFYLDVNDYQLDLSTQDLMDLTQWFEVRVTICEIELLNR